MKKFLLFLLMILGCAFAQAQSLSMSDLTSLATLKNDAARNYLTAGNKFKLMTIEQIDGMSVEEFQSTKGGAANQETVLIGMGIKNAEGDVLHTVNYKTKQKNHILNLLGQAPNTGLNLYFRGNDRLRNIYLYNSFAYQVMVYLSLDESEGSIVIKQKDLPAF